MVSGQEQLPALPISFPFTAMVILR